MLAAYEAHDASAVGPVVGNANPGSQLSWANLLLAYGEWLDPARAGASLCNLPMHNLTARRDVLLAYGEDLEDHLGRDGSLMRDLCEAEATMRMAPGADIVHVNPSTFRSTASLRFQAGRMYGHPRAPRERWPAWRRWAYALLFPLIPLVRAVKLRRDHQGSPHEEVLARVMGGVAFALVCDAVGQAAGYVRGPGRSHAVLATFEMDRAQHLRRADRDVLRA